MRPRLALEGDLARTESRFLSCCAVPLNSTFGDAPSASPPRSPQSEGLRTLLQKHATSLPIAVGYILCSSLLMVLNKLALQEAVARGRAARAACPWQ